MKATEHGRVTPEMLDELDRWSGKPDRKPWSMGVSSHVVAALVAEVREHRERKEPTMELTLVCDCGTKLVVARDTFAEIREVVAEAGWDIKAPSCPEHTEQP